MSEQVRAEHGDIFWNECNTRDPDAAKDFYQTVMGWEMQDGPMPNGEGRYIVAKKGEQMICGFFPMLSEMFPEHVPSHWMTYLAVDDLDATLTKVGEAGGEITTPAFDVEGVGRFAMVRDPSGAIVGLAQPTQS